MQLKNLLCVLFLLLSFYLIRAQQGCPAVTIANGGGSGQLTLPCGTTCTTLTAVPFESGNTATYSVAPIPYQPFAYDAGTIITVPSDDQWSQVIDLPFTFCYFDKSYTQVVIGSNGQISFNTANSGHFDNWKDVGPVPANTVSDAVANCIMGPWQDIDLTYKGTMYSNLIGTAPCRILVVSWYQCPFYGDPNSKSYSYCTQVYKETSQIVLYETTNAIEVYIAQKDVICNDLGNKTVYASGYWDNGWATEGIVDPTGTIAYTVPGRNASQWTATNDAWRFTPNGPSIVNVNWYQGDSLISADSAVNVCLAEQTVYTAEAIYAPCAGGTNDTVSSSIIVSLADSLLVRIDSTKNLSCFGANDGAAYAHVSRGLKPFSYGWSNGSSSLAITNLAAGTYVFTAEDAYNCPHKQTVVITQPPAVNASVPPVTDNKCLDIDTLQVTTSGGISPYTYMWNNGEHCATDTAISSGTYKVTVTDAHSCTATATGVLTVHITNDNMALNPPQINNITCFGSANGGITAVVSGGSTPYVYQWSTGPATVNISNLGPGPYQISVTDAAGCTVTASYNLSQPAVLAINDSTLSEPGCFGGSDGQISITVIGGTGAINYSWSNAGNSATDINLTAGSYAVTITDVQGCSLSDAFLLKQPKSISIQSAVIDSPNCFGSSTGSITVTATGGTGILTYKWKEKSTGALFSGAAINALPADIYTLTITDGNNCTATATYQVNQPPQLVIDSISTLNTSCSQWNATVFTEGGTPPLQYLWSAGVPNNLASVTAIPAGSLAVTVTDSKTCNAASSVTINQPGAIVVSLAGLSNETCYGDSNASITVLASGATAPYIYTWNNGIKNRKISNILPGPYTVTVTDAVGCSTTSTYNITQPAQLIINDSTLTKPLCFGATNGQISITAIGGTGALSYAWSNAQNSAIAVNLTIGLYAVTVTDVAGCTVSDSYQLNQPKAINVLNVTIDSASCFGTNTGSITITTSGGTGTLNYSWKETSNGATFSGAAITGLGADSYSLTITDSNNCKYNKTYQVMQPALLVIDSITVQNVSCNNRSAKVYTEGGSPTYQYLWSAGSPNNQVSVTGLGAGMIAVSVTDSKGCLSADSVNIVQPGAITITLSALSNETCFGNSDASITVSAGGATAPYTYAWSNAVNNRKISNVLPGSYTVTVTDALGCSAANTYNVTQPLQVVITDSILTQPSCFGGTNGQIEVTASGGTGSLSYVWSNAQTTSTANGLATGPYTLTITDSLSCSASGTFQLNQPTAIRIKSAVVDSASCFGTSTGDITVSGTGGTGTLQYNWTEASNGNTFTGAAITGLAADNYTLTITDSNNCKFNKTYQVFQPTLLTIDSITIQSISCNDRTATVYTEGGSPIYQYLWSAGSPNNLIAVTGLGAGMIAVSVTDSKGCLSADSVNIVQPGAITITLSALSNETCFGNSDASITVSAGGATAPYTYAWSNAVNNRKISNVLPGSYTVTVTDALGCSAANTYNVTQPLQVVITDSILTQPSCFGGTNGQIEVTASGGTGSLSYVWSNAQTTSTANGLATGPYTLTITDSLSCSASGTFQLNQPTAIRIKSAVVDSASCFGTSTGDITVSGTGGTGTLQYNWTEASNGNTFTGAAITGLAADNYTLTITDSNNCKFNKTYQVFQPTLLTIDSITIQSISCNDRTATVYTEGGSPIYQYLWSAGSPNNLIAVTGLGAGMISVSVTDSKGCLSADSVNIVQPGAITITLSALNNETCYGTSDASITVLASGATAPYTYAWSNTVNNRKISNVLPGSYTVTVTDALGCSAANTYNVTQPAQVTITDSILTQPSCFGGTNGQIAVTASGGTGSLSYVWSNAQTTSTANGLATGPYTLTITDSLSCSASGTFQLNRPTAIRIKSAVVDSASCFGTSTGDITISGTGGTGTLQYNWTEASNGNTFTGAAITGLAADNYTLTITDSNNCKFNKTYQVFQPTLLTIDSITIQSISCNDRTATVYTEGGSPVYQYIWSAGSPNNLIAVTGLGAGMISVSVTDSKGCLSADSVNIVQPGAITITLSSLNNETCYGNSDASITVLASGATAPYTYAWSNAVNNRKISNVLPGSYTVTVTDALGCSAANTYNVTQPAQVAITDSILTQPSCFGGTNGQIAVTASGGTGSLSYVWSNAQTTSTANGLATGLYTLTITDSLSCSVSGTFQLNQPTAIRIKSAIIDSATCFGTNTGDITISGTGGTGTLQYNWTEVSNGNTFTGAAITGLAADNYSVTITDSNNCKFNKSYQVFQPTLLTIDSITVQIISCNDRGAMVYTEGGVSPYQYLWSAGSPNNQISVNGLGAGTIAVSVTDNKGCVAIDSVTISQPGAISISLVSLNNEICYGDANGAITVLAGGTTGPYTYGWSEGARGRIRSNLLPSIYTVTVSDAIGCSLANSYNITQPAQLLISDTALTQPTCFGSSNGQIAITAVGGTGILNYLWSNSQAVATAINLAAGPYSLTITDSVACSVSASYQLQQPAQILIDSISLKSISCSGKSATVYVEGGITPYQYLWNSGSPNNQNSVSGLGVGTVAVSVTDAQGCLAADSVVINQPGAIVISIINLINETCFGDSNGAITVSAAGTTAPYSYLWNNGVTADSLINLAPGPYLLTVTDAIGCTTTNTYNITQPAPVMISDTLITPPSCFGDANGQISVTAIGGTGTLNYTWNNNQTAATAISLAHGLYSLTVTDSVNCSLSATIQLNQPAAITIKNITIDSATCYGSKTGIISVSATGGSGMLNYNWTELSNGAVYSGSAITGLGADIYLLSITDANGCVDSSKAKVLQPSEFIIDSISVQTISCNNWSAAVHVEGGITPYRFLWSAGVADSGITVTGLSAGTVTVSVTDSKSCFVADSVNIVQPGAVVISTVSLKNEICFGDSNASIAISAAGGTPGYSYIWSTSGRGDAIQNLTPGPYSVTALDVVGCSSTAAYNITQPALLQIIDSAITQLDCFGGANGRISITVIGGTGSLNYFWSNSQTTATASGLSAGPYALTINDASGCSLTNSYQLNQPPAIIIQQIIIDSVTCFGTKTGKVSVTAAGGTGNLHYTWTATSNGVVFAGSTITGIGADFYLLNITDANGCSDTSAYQVKQPSQLVIDSVAIQSVSCHVWSAAANVNGGTVPYQYAWSAGIAVNANSVTGLSAGTIAVSVTDSKGCPAVDSATIVQPGAIVISLLSLNNENCYGDSIGSITVSAGGSVGPYNYLWNDAAVTANAAVTALPVGNYSVSVTDADKCSATQSYIITQPPVLKVAAPQITNIGCAGGNTGAITANSAGGTPGYTYSWLGQTSGQTWNTQTIAGVGPDIYQLTITDTNKCSLAVNYQVTAIPVLTFTLTSNDITCHGASNGNVLIDVTSGTPPYRYSWTGNGTAHDSLFDNAGPGPVTGWVVDSNNCSCAGCNYAAQITEPEQIFIDNIQVQNVACFGDQTGGILVRVTGGVSPFDLEWSNGATTDFDSAIQAGIYTLSVTDAHLCKASLKDTITQPDVLTLALTPFDARCYAGADGSIIPLSAGGNPGYSYKWSNGACTDTARWLVAGVYSCTLSDSKHCTTSATTSINQPSAISLNTIAFAVKCPGQQNGAISVTDSGGVAPYKYAATKDNENFIFSDAQIQGLDTGWYEVQVVDGNGCTIVTKAYVPNPVMDEDSVSTRPTSCYGPEYNNGAVSVNVYTDLHAPYEFSLDDAPSNTSGEFLNVSAGQHTVVITNANGCQDTVPVVVSQPLPIVVVVTPDSMELEPGDGQPVLVAYQNITDPVYSWSPPMGLSCSDCPQPVVNTFIPGDYTVTLTRQNDSSNCWGSATLHVSLKPHQKIFIPDIFSPNGDGNNDLFLVYGDEIRAIEMKVFNRWGEMIYEGNSQLTGWDGTYKGQKQLPGTYAYSVKVFFLDNTETEKNGTVVLAR